MTSLTHPVIPFPRNRRATRVFGSISNALVQHLTDSGSTYLKEGAERYQKGEVRRARDCFVACLKVDPDCAAAAFNLGLLLQQDDLCPQAIVLYRRAIALDKKNVQAYFNLGFALRTVGRLAEAEQAFQSGLGLAPKRADIWLVLGITRTELGEVEGAARAFSRGTSLDPANASLHAFLGMALKDLGDISGAIDSFQRALQLEPDHTYAKFNLDTLMRLLRSGALKVDSAPVRRPAPHIAGFETVRG
ncbi:MAG: tetratricopeptide repeat protein [Cyanobacteria bacterium REEB65]|nr:tetratricopeptide repeat protein [Cyanobacteria bacterium REEB65]